MPCHPTCQVSGVWIRFSESEALHPPRSMPSVQRIIHSRASLSDLLAYIVHYSLLCIDRTFLTEHTMKIVMLAKIPACEGGDLCTTPALTRSGFHMEKMVSPALSDLPRICLSRLHHFGTGFAVNHLWARPNPWLYRVNVKKWDKQNQFFVDILSSKVIVNQRTKTDPPWARTIQFELLGHYRSQCIQNSTI